MNVGRNFNRFNTHYYFRTVPIIILLFQMMDEQLYQSVRFFGGCRAGVPNL